MKTEVWVVFSILLKSSIWEIKMGNNSPHLNYLSCHQKEHKSILNRDLRLHTILYLRLGTPWQNQTSHYFSCVCSSTSMIFLGFKWALKAQSSLEPSQAFSIFSSVMREVKVSICLAYTLPKKGLGAGLKNLPKYGSDLQETDIYFIQWSLFSEIC